MRWVGNNKKPVFELSESVAETDGDLFEEGGDGGALREGVDGHPPVFLGNESYFSS